MEKQERDLLKEAKSNWKKNIIASNSQYKGLSAEQIARKLNKENKTTISRY